MFFYDTGTLNVRNVYTTATLSTPHPSPLVADAAGRVPPIYLDPAFTYRVRVCDAVGSIIKDVDPFSLLDSASLAFIQSGTGAVVRTAQAKMREVIAASDFGFGKAGNTSAQNSTALQAAIAYQQTVGGALHIPNTTGVYTDPISVVLGGVPLVMIGEGQASSILRKPSNDANPVLTISSTGTLYPYCYFNGIRFDNGLRGTRAGIGVKLVDVPTFVFDRCVFEGCATGVLGQGALIGTFVDCSVLNCDVGYDFTRSAALVYANLLNVERGEIKGNTIGLRYDYGAQLSINRADIEANGLTGNTATGAIFLGSNLSTEVGYSQVYINAWFEVNKGVTIKGASPGTNSVITIDQSWFVGNETATEVQLSGWKAIKLSGVVAPTGTWTTQAADFDSDITSIINALVDTSTSGPTNLRTATQRYYNSMDLARIRTKAYALSTQDLLMASDDQILGGATKDVGFAKYGDGEFYLGTTSAKRVRMNTTGLGFFGAAPVARSALAANATDLATAITLVNDIKAKLIALGLTT